MNLLKILTAGAVGLGLLLLTNEASKEEKEKIAVKNKRTQATGTMVWEGDDYRLGQVKEMPSSIPIKKGDTLITSGYSRNYPEGIEVGYIKNFKKDPSSGFYNIEFEFSADYNKLEYVYVVRNLFKVEQDILEKSIKDDE